MARRLSIAMFVDACGFEVLAPRPWFLDELTYRARVTSIFGYSSACVPAILTGKRPAENDHWSAFFYSPATSPFRALRPLRLLPRTIRDRRPTRSLLSSTVARFCGFTGYFQLYTIPFEILPYLDYGEKRDIFRPGGINRGTSIFDDLAASGVPHHVSDWRRPEVENLGSLRRAIQKAEIRFAFLYTANLDSLLHSVGKESSQVDRELSRYQTAVRELLALAADRYDDVRFALFSDHGMATVEEMVDLIPAVESTGLCFGRDYVAVYDSTMMRFWFLQAGADTKIRGMLRNDQRGRWVDDDEHRAFGTYWPDHRFGDAVYALAPGVLLCPSHMGSVRFRGMHGYTPEAPDSDSALLANFTPTTQIATITDYYALMHEMSRWSAG